MKDIETALVIVVRLELTVPDAQTLINVLDHVHHQAVGSAASNYGIDTLCRKDCAVRFLALRSYIQSNLPKEMK